MEEKAMSTRVRRKTNALANRGLANMVMSGALLCQPSGTVAIGRLSPQLELIERREAEKTARQEAARRAKEAAAKRRTEEDQRREEAARIRREAQPIREVTGD